MLIHSRMNLEDHTMSFLPLISLSKEVINREK